MTELSLLAKATLTLAIALVAVQAARRASAALRSLVLAVAFGVLLVLPAAAWLVPARTVEVRLPPATGALFFVDDITATSPAPLPRLAAAGAPAPPRRVPPAATLLRSVWAAGFALFIVPVVVSLLRLRRLRRMAIPWREGDTLVEATAAQAAIARRIELFLHERLSAPMTCGIWRPAIGLPVDAPRWSEAELRRALVHEIEHVRRKDWPLHVLARIVCAAYWFHPLVWMAWRQLCLESERACDDAVLRQAESTAYADQLLALARRVTAGPAPLLSMAGRSDLSTRIRAVLDDAQTRSRVGALAAAAILLAAGTLTLALSPLQAVPGQSSPTPGSAPETPLAFAVASVRPHTAGERMIRVNTFPGGRFVASNVRVRQLVRLAYGVEDHQIEGGPSWMDSDAFDITALADRELPQMGGPFSAGGALPAMLKSLLAERFGLVARTEIREQPMYALVMARPDRRLGERLTASAIDCAAEFAKRKPEDGAPPCGIRMSPGTIVLEGAPVSQLASLLTGVLRRSVVDRTGLQGTYDLQLHWQPRMPAPQGDPPPASDPPPLFTALEEQAGMKLENTRGPQPVLVIERLERPTPNNEPVPSAARPPEAQVPAGERFEVASIRRNTSGDPIVRGVMIQPSGRVVASNIPLRWLIASAYGVHLMQITGGPEWLDSERYDIDALGPAQPTQEQARAMVRTLLTERTRLVVHQETREQPVFALKRVRPDSLGAGLRPAAAECTPIKPPANSPFPAPPPPPAAGDPSQGVPLMPPGGGELPRCGRMFMPGFIGARQISIADFAGNLRQFVGRPVVDRTGLTGAFDLDVAFAMDFAPRGAPPVPPGDGQPTLFTALREQLGLTLEQERGNVQVLVIDRVERPSEN